jgi:carbon monoxide dehydrogenase subunit G
MASSSTTRLVQAPVEAVWEALADFGAISRWGTGVDQSNLLTEGPIGLGTTRRVQVGRNTLRETITTWEPGVKLAYSLVGLPPVVRAVTNTWELVAEGSSTKVTLTSTVKGRPLIAHLVAGKLGKAGVQLVDGLSKHVTGALA